MIMKIFLFMFFLSLPITTQAQAVGGEVRRPSKPVRPVVNIVKDTKKQENRKKDSSSQKTKDLTSCPDSNHPHMIDLGLPSGTLWACCNVGAKKPEDYGGYYAWGETKTKSTYNWSTYIHCGGTKKTCRNLGFNITGTSYDAATANWGMSWKMPTIGQFKELHDKTTSVWITRFGVKGRKFTGPNGGTIFLPAAGYMWDGGLFNVGSWGRYWSSTPYDGDDAYGLNFISGNVDTGSCWRGGGRSVRPVRK